MLFVKHAVKTAPMYCFAINAIHTKMACGSGNHTFLRGPPNPQGFVTSTKYQAKIQNFDTKLVLLMQLFDNVL